MDFQKMTNEELEKELHQLHQKMKIRKMPIDEHGNLILDGNNPDDAEWYHSDDKYDLIYDKENDCDPSGE